MTTQDDINAFTSNCSAACLLTLAAKTADETIHRSVRVATVNDLPDLSLETVMLGTVMWVDSLNMPVLAQAGCWTGLDNREVRSDCTIKQAWSWGSNIAGRLGDNTTTNRSSPVQVVGGFTDWCAASAGIFHTVAVTSSGSAWAWGCNGVGRLGDGITTDQSSPVSVVGDISNWCYVSAGACHTVALTSTGNAWSWGLGLCGRLGDLTITDASSPVSVMGGFTDWCQISAGSCHSVAVRTSGSVWAWGSNVCGRLGDNTVTARSSPVSVVGEFCDWCQASAGQCHSLGVRISGSAWAWGIGTNGRLGDGTTTNRSSPVSVTGNISDWRSVSAGYSHSMGVTNGGNAWSWGYNGGGRLGDGTATSRLSPVSVVGGFTDWCAVSAGELHSVAVTSSGSAWAWGSNLCGRLGDGTVTNRSSPVSVVGGISDWCSVSAGGSHTVAIRQF